jgi:cation/acetate symporter
VIAGNPILNISIFGLFVLFTLVVVIVVSRNSEKKAGAFYTGGASFSGRQNGLAITGDYLSAASFLGVTGAIAIYGYDGLLYALGFFVAWLVAIYLVAEPLRNTGQYTMADVLSFRMNQRPVRTAAALSTLAVSFFYLLAQMAGAGGLVALLLGVSDPIWQSLVIAIVGLVMIVYVLVGGMKGTTWVQMIKATLLILGGAVMTFWVLYHFGFNFNALVNGAIGNPGNAASVAKFKWDSAAHMLDPMAKYGKDPLSFISLSMALVLGTAGLPHVLMRFYTVPTAKEARRSAVWAIALIGIFYLFTLVLGLGATALVGMDKILAAPGKENSAAPLLAYALGGEILMGIISGIAFATILAVVAGLTITASASFAHDFYNSVLKKGKADPAQEVKVARITSVVIGILAIIGGIAVNGQNIAFLISLAFAVAASANLPSILMTLYWKKFNTRGSVASIYTGLLSSVLLIIFSPAVMLPIGTATNPLALFPLTNPTIVTIPLAFIAGWLGTVTSKVPADADLQAEMEVRSMTGAGAAEAVAH